MSFVDVPVDVQPARLQVVAHETFSKPRTPSVLPALRDIAHTEWRGVRQEYVRAGGYAVIYGLRFFGLVLKCAEGVEWRSL